MDNFCGIDRCYVVADENVSYTKFLKYLIFLAYNVLLPLWLCYTSLIFLALIQNDHGISKVIFSFTAKSRMQSQ